MFCMFSCWSLLCFRNIMYAKNLYLLSSQHVTVKTVISLKIQQNIDLLQRVSFKIVDFRLKLLKFWFHVNVRNMQARQCWFQVIQAKFRCRTSHEPNWMQMSKILCSPSFAFDSAHVKYGIWTGPYRQLKFWFHITSPPQGLWLVKIFITVT